MMLRYQVEVFEAALRGNTIAVLDTGSGKTMVAVMLAREHVRRVRAGEAPRRIVLFLAPTVHLVHQQFEVIREYTDLDATECYGASGVAEWTAEQWKEEVGSKEWKPAVFGMTASPVATKGTSTIQDCEAHIAQLELTLDAKVYIIQDRSELESFSPPATIVNKFYDAYLIDFEDLKSKLQTLYEEFDALLVSLEESSPNRFEDTNNILETSRKTLSRYHGKIFYSLNYLGPIITAEVVKIYNESIKTLGDSEDCLFSKASFNLHESYFKEALYLIEEVLPQGYEELMKSESGSAHLSKRGYISSKVDALINIFKSFGSSNEVICLIFVDRIMTAKAVERFMRGIVNFSSFSISYLTGGSTSKDSLSPAVQRFTLDLFRAGKVNLLFTTDVTEEGIDVPNCSCVIRFDLPRTVCSYVQSRGRARRSNSNYVLMIERSPNVSSSNSPMQEKYTYHVDSTGATITAECCVNLIRKYCEKLPKDRTAEDSFEEMYNGKASPFSSFMEYYHEKYGIIIQHPNQPLLLLKQSHNPHNLLFSKLKYIALVGAYYVGGGIVAALWVMRWFGIEIKCDRKLVQEVKLNASYICYLPKIRDIEELEAKLKYTFSVKGLLLEAITHPSLQESGVDYCYQRLEFLGDSVLDLLITRYLYVTHTDVDPGELTDLRSALVSNENFAQVVVRNNVHSHLKHGSGILLEQVTEYVRSNSERQGKDNEFLQHATSKVPKVLGDIMESIAGAIFVDSDFNVDLVWKIVEPLLSPMITPDNLALPPYRELLELCSHLGYFINSKCSSKGEEVIIDMSVQLRDELLIAQGHDRNKKSAKAKAAARILADLKKRGLSIKQCLSKAKQLDVISSDLQSHLTSLESPLGYSDMNDYSSLGGLSSLKEAVVLTLKMDKGGPRSALFKLCKRLQWPMPEFEFVEQRFRTPIVLDGVTTTNFNSFVSTITLHVPDVTVITLEGERRTDKKASQDSASLIMLHKLQELKVCICKT
ncbi:hypothetical protein ACQ4PT_000868 [Festuca glaucescens]